MYYATRYNNALKVAYGDNELEKAIESEFERVKFGIICGTKIPLISLTLFNDLSYIIDVDKIEKFVDVDPNEIGNFLNRISKKYPEQVMEFLQILSNVAKEHIKSLR